VAAVAVGMVQGVERPEKTREGLGGNMTCMRYAPSRLCSRRRGPGSPLLCSGSDFDTLTFAISNKD
jgi:hypothetical protein